MTLRPALLLSAPLLSLVFLLGACTRQAPGADTAVAPEAPPPAASTASAAEPAPAAGPDIPVGPAPVAGVDYVELAKPQPYAPADGRIEVAEVFSYTCPHCAHFEPMLLEWRARQPADVRFTPVAGFFGANPEPFARAFYAAESLGVRAKTHEAMFDALHGARTLNAQAATPQAIAAVYARSGVAPAQFTAAMASAATTAAIRRANDFIQASGVDGTPGIVVAGKYRVTGKTMEDMLRITTHLVAKERAARGG